MAADAVANLQDLMREFRGPLVYNMFHKCLFLAEIEKNMDRKRWDGKYVTVPVVLNPFLQGAQAITETGEVGEAEQDDTMQARIASGIIEISIGLTTQLMNQAKNGEGSWVDALKFKVDRAEKSLVALANEASINGNAGAAGLLAPILTDDTTTDTVDVGTDANFFLLYVGRKVDIRDISTGAYNGDGDGLKIESTDEDAGTVTFTTSLTAVDGTTTGQEGIFILNSGLGANDLPQGIGQVFNVGDTFENNVLGTPAGWLGNDCTPGSPAEPTKQLFDLVERKAARVCGDKPDWYVADPAVADRYGDIRAELVRYQADMVKLNTGFEGYSYKGKAILPMDEVDPGLVYGVKKDDIRIYTLDDGPDWDDLTGSRFQRFDRKLPVESWMVWMYQLGFHRIASQIKIGNLTRADGEPVS